MSRLRRLAFGVAALGLVVGVLAPAPGAQPKDLADLMMDLNITPLEPRAAPPLTVTTMDGGRLALADLKGRAALVYFWATW